MVASKEELAIEELVKSCQQDPLRFVLVMFPWNSDRNLQQVRLPEKYRARYPNCEWGPDVWACEFLDELGAEIRARGFDMRAAVDPIRFATASGHGIGKTAITAWLILFIMSCYSYAKGTVTAGTADQLRTKTWAELGKWHDRLLCKHWFTYRTGKGSMSLRSNEKPTEWFVNGLTCRKEDAQSFAGQHNPNSVSFYVFDESSQIDQEVFNVREGGLTDGMPMTFDFGNPTENTGPFFERCRGKLRGRHIVRQIDSRDVQITNKSIIAEWVEDYGEDSDFVKVRVRGEFPSAGFKQFISTESVERAVELAMVEDLTAPVVLGVDVARFGDNDSVIFIRCGRDGRSWQYRKFSGYDTVRLTAEVSLAVEEFRDLGRDVARIFVDGAGIGGAVVDNLRSNRFDVTDVNFGSKPLNPMMYRNRGDECWGRMERALARGQLFLPDDERLQRELTQRLYDHTPKGQIALESKRSMHEMRRVGSPDVADALALTYAEDVAHTMRMETELERMHRVLGTRPSTDPRFAGKYLPKCMR